ncbi:hypothetical protein [Brachybacterium sp. FME24]|uniref:hypothetical protein n=1 Tax=Brachybacterium sp. FME24 TaxID=2742605 RepID=UPI0018664BD4|nr:hypothetical protein [Brachybacterium sp. FME24]
MSQPPQPPDPQRPEGPQSPHGDGSQPAPEQSSAPEAPQYGSPASSYGQSGDGQYWQQDQSFAPVNQQWMPPGQQELPFDAGAAAPGSQQFPSQPYSSQQGEPPRSSGIGKGPIFAIIGCVVLVFVLVVGIGGFFVIRALMADESPQGTESSEEAPAEETPAEEETESGAEETTEPEEESTSAEEEAEGSPVGLANALPAGSTIDYLGSGGVEVSVTFGEIDWDAEAAVMEANSFNEPAPDGQKYVLVDIAIVNNSEEEFSNFAWAKIDFVDAEGTVYEDAGQVMPATAAGEDGPAAPGDSTMAQALFLVPEDLPEGGHFVISDFMGPEEGTWVEAV